MNLRIRCSWKCSNVSGGISCGNCNLSSPAWPVKKEDCIDSEMKQNLTGLSTGYRYMNQTGKKQNKDMEDIKNERI